MKIETPSQAELQEMVDQLAAYVSSDAAFRPIVVEEAGGPHHSTLTLGILLQALASAESSETAPIEAAMDAVRSGQAEGWAEKIQKELRSSANLWCAAIDDLERSDGGGAWRTEAMRRTRAQRLIEEADRVGADIAEERARLSACDGRAKRNVGPCAFMLDTSVEAAHPREAYWWLYARPGAS